MGATPEEKVIRYQAVTLVALASGKRQYHRTDHALRNGKCCERHAGAGEDSASVTA
jgi:hypothetical protein